MTTIIETSRYTIVAILFDADAPQTVSHFKELAENGFYNGLAFFKHIPGILIQTGCPNNNGTGHSGTFIKDEINDTIRYEDGTIAMASCGENTSSSQFFICLDRNEASLFEGNHTAFAKVIPQNLDELRALRKGDTIISIKFNKD
jgi:peptidyl-prolyl cis-trans isomerase B (cyclophilin B)